MENKSDAVQQEPDMGAYFEAIEDASEFEHYLDQHVEDGNLNPLADWQASAFDWQESYWRVIIAYWNTMKRPYMEYTFRHPDLVVPGWIGIREVFEKIIQQMRYMYQQIGQMAVHEPPLHDPDSAAARAARIQLLQQRWVHMLNDVARKLAYYGVEEAKRIEDGFVWVTCDASIPADIVENNPEGYV